MLHCSHVCMAQVTDIDTEAKHLDPHHRRWLTTFIIAGSSTPEISHFCHRRTPLRQLSQSISDRASLNHFQSGGLVK